MTYMKTRIARSIASTDLFHSRTTATTKAMNGTTTAPRFAYRVSFGMALRLLAKLPPVLVEFLALGGQKTVGCAQMEGIPPEVAAVLRPVLPDLAAETIRAIGEQVPDYSRPLEGRLGVALRYGTERALRRFVDSIEQPGVVSERDRRIYVELGRLEL